jgi:signal transduction histidine kinase
LVLPWESEAGLGRFGQAAGYPPFARLIREGEEAELRDRAPEKAADTYRSALRVARGEIQQAYARLLLARALKKTARGRDARLHYTAVLDTALTTVDEHGVPLALYAAGPLLHESEGPRAVLARLQAAASARWPAPAAAYMLRQLFTDIMARADDAATRAAAQALRAKMDATVQRIEQALAIQREFPRLLDLPRDQHTAEADNPRWFLYGREPWLVTITSPREPLPSVLLAVRATDAIALVNVQAMAHGPSGPIRLSLSDSSRGEPLGPALAGVTLEFPPLNGAIVGRETAVQRRYYLSALLLVIGLTGISAWLVWRDVRRELHLAQLRSQFVSSVSHELKTPLTAIRLFAETLQLRDSVDAQARAEYLETIVNETERLSRLLSNLLDFSKIERGQRIYRAEPASLTEIVRAAARAMRYPFEQQGFRLRVDMPERLPQVRVDRDGLEQAILNLLANALKYSGDRRDIDLRLSVERDHAVIEVVDRGIGIPPAEQAHIFQKFYRIPTPENQRIPGAGLGLALVAHFAEAHGGRVEVRSVPGKGSTFAIHLPFEPAHSEEPRRDLASTVPTAESRASTR